MARIERLSEELANQIKAGEVVERPASVVKELVENAIDAEARSVNVELEKGGKSLVKVRDDGVGMDRADAEHCLERHATSKLQRIEQLQSIGTQGFRGEALAAIASVSHLLLRTRPADAESGTEVEVDHGERAHVRDVGHPRGTTVEVRDLFGSVPARRKFLRADSTEASHVAEAVTLLGLPRPELALRLIHGGRRLVDASPVADVEERVYQLFGAKYVETMARVDTTLEWADVTGFVATPGAPPSRRPILRLFVNSRPVRDRALARALTEGYRAAAARDRRPEAILFVDVPGHMVDVNVHPAKTEVRFADGRLVFTAVADGVREALSNAGRVAIGVPALPGRIVEATERLAARGQAPPWRLVGADAESRRTDGDASVVPKEELSSASVVEAVAPRVLGQHRNTYIVTTNDEELVIFDQHTAHERVRFEALLESADGGVAEAQRLVAPVVMELAPALAPVLEEHGETLDRLGYDVEAFGGSSLRLRSVPSSLGSKDPGPTLEALLRDLLEAESTRWAVAETRDRVIATVACHSVARAGQPLNWQQMQGIVEGLMKVRHPTLCPHGRPTHTRMPAEELTSLFGRTGWRRQ